MAVEHDSDSRWCFFTLFSRRTHDSDSRWAFYSPRPPNNMALIAVGFVSHAPIVESMGLMAFGV